jgi:DNA-binding Lrp family transcriptional regulator
MGIDVLDGRIIALLAREPRLGVLEMSRRLGVARGTVQARLDRLQARGVIATLQIRQGSGTAVRAHLASVPEVLELHTTTGSGDMLCRLVARSNADLQRVIDLVVGFDGIVRASTAIVMENAVPLRVIPLVEQAARLVSPQAEPAAGAAG